MSRTLINYLSTPGDDLLDLAAALLSALNSPPFATAEQGALAATAIQPDDLGSAAFKAVSYFSVAAEGDLARSALQPTAQTFTTDEQAQIQANIGVNSALILALLTSIAASLPTSAPTTTRGLWRNGEAGMICYSNQGDLS
jgi:hypothetical protein